MTKQIGYELFKAPVQITHKLEIIWNLKFPSWWISYGTTHQLNCLFESLIFKGVKYILRFMQFHSMSLNLNDLAENLLGIQMGYAIDNTISD